MNARRAKAWYIAFIVWLTMLTSGNADAVALALSVSIAAVIAALGYRYSNRPLEKRANQYFRVIEYPRSRAERAYTANLHANRVRGETGNPGSPCPCLSCQDWALEVAKAYPADQPQRTARELAPPMTLTPNGQPEVIQDSPRGNLDPGKAELFRALTSAPAAEPVLPCTEGGPCKIGHRRVVRDNHGNRVATLCLGCGAHTYDQGYLDHGGKF